VAETSRLDNGKNMHHFSLRNSRCAGVFGWLRKERVTTGTRTGLRIFAGTTRTVRGCGQWCTVTVKARRRHPDQRKPLHHRAQANPIPFTVVTVGNSPCPDLLSGTAAVGTNGSPDAREGGTRTWSIPSTVIGTNGGRGRETTGNPTPASPLALSGVRGGIAGIRTVPDS
jgi:hypothetical protein